MSDIREQINILANVQAVEVEIDKAERQIRSLENEAAALDHAAGEHEERVTAEKEALAVLKKSYRELESESKINADMIVKSNEKLRAVKTNKEYQSTLKEIEELRKKNSGIEDRMLEELEAIERAEVAIGEEETAMSVFLKQCQDNKETLAARVERERQAVDILRDKQQHISAEADPKSMAILDDVRKKVRGLAVVPVERATCTGCHMNIPPQLFNELQRFDEIRNCPHCQRIIYWKENKLE